MPANKTFQLSARFTEEERNRLVEYCEKNDLPVAQVMRKAIREFLDREEKTK